MRDGRIMRKETSQDVSLLTVRLKTKILNVRMCAGYYTQHIYCNMYI